jgi:hypothetical protein
MAPNGLSKRVERLEASVPPLSCRTCAARPVFATGGVPAACPECGAEPRTFTIDIDAARGRGDAAA